MIEIAEKTSAIRKGSRGPGFELAGQGGNGNTSGEALSASSPVTPGGIHLGQGDYLEVIDFTEDGRPLFDPVEFKQFQQDFIGVIPVPILTPVPVNIFQLTGLDVEQENRASKQEGPKRIPSAYFDDRNVRVEDRLSALN